MPQPPQQQGIPRPPQTPSVYDQFLMQQQQQLDSNPQRRVKDIQGHYTQLIRERLRNLLQKHRGGAQQDDDDLDNEAPPASTSSRPKISMKNRHFQQHPTVAPYDYQQQQFTKDMMTSMAKLMTAVGDIVTNNAENNSRGRRSRSRGRSRSRSANKRSSSLPPEVQKLQDKQDFVLQMAAALNPNSKNNLPKNKSGVMDMIMSKLQVPTITINLMLLCIIFDICVVYFFIVY